MRKQVSISIDTEVANKAKALGINISKASENYLRLLIQAIENAHKGKEAGPMGFEPMTFSLEGQIDWNAFREWIDKKNFNRRYATTLFNYAQRYHTALLTRDLSTVRDLPDSQRPNVLKALSTLAKFTGKYEDWKELLKNYDLSWMGRSKDDIFIDRLNKIKDPEEVWTWIRKVKEYRPDLQAFMDLMSYTGLRFIESVNSYNLIVELKDLSSYYNEEKQALEHFRFKETFIRSSKKAFFSFVPKALLSRIHQGEALSSADSIQKLVHREGLKLRFSDIREAHATLMVSYLQESEINFLHGRVTNSVFMTNYFNPALISDLKVRAFRGIVDIQQKIGGDRIAF